MEIGRDPVSGFGEVREELRALIGAQAEAELGGIRSRGKSDRKRTPFGIELAVAGPKVGDLLDRRASPAKKIAKMLLTVKYSL